MQAARGGPQQQEEEGEEPPGDEEEELEEDEEDLGAHLEEVKGKLHGRSGCPLWVLKASDSNRGQDVHLFTSGRHVYVIWQYVIPRKSASY